MYAVSHFLFDFFVVIFCSVINGPNVDMPTPHGPPNNTTTNLNQNLIFVLTRSIFERRKKTHTLTEMKQNGAANTRNWKKKWNWKTCNPSIQFSNDSTYFSWSPFWCLDANKSKILNSSKDCTWDSQCTRTDNICICKNQGAARTQTDTRTIITQYTLV